MTKRFVRLLQGGMVCGALLLLALPAMATPINGTATWTGVFTLYTSGVLAFCPPVTPTQTNCPNAPSPAPGWNVPGSGTGDLAAYGGDASGGTITPLSQGTNPVGVTLASPTLFVTFAPAAGVTDISFFMQTVFAGNGDPACTGANITCTPPGSAVTFVNTGGGNSSATISMQGFARHAADAGSGFALASPLQMVFTAQFNKTYSQVLTDFNAAGFLTSTYSANFSSALSAVPEPVTLSLIGFGLFAFGVLGRRLAKK